MSIPRNIAVNWFVAIEGLGDTSASTSSLQKRHRYCAGPAPSWDSDSLYKAHALAWLEFAGMRVDMRTAQGATGGGGFALACPSVDTHEIRSVFGRRRHLQIGKVESEHDENDVNIALDVSGHNGETVYWGREVIVLGTYNAPSNGYLSCTRGALGTRATRHRIGSRIYPTMRVKDGRRVTVGYYDDNAASYSDEVEIAQWYIVDYSVRDLVEYRFECDGTAGALAGRQLWPEQWVGRAREFFNGFLFINAAQRFRRETVTLPGAIQSARTAANGGNADTRGGTGSEPATGDAFYVAVEGVVYRAYVTDTETFTAMCYIGDPAFGGEPANVSADDLGDLDIREVLVSAQDATFGNDGLNSAQLPLGWPDAHPLRIWLQVATSTEDGDNGPFDVGIPLGPGIPSDWIATDIANELIQEDAGRLVADRFIFGLWDAIDRDGKGGEEFLDLMDREIAAAGIVRTEGTDGTISFARITDSDLVYDSGYDSTTTAITEDLIDIESGVTDQGGLQDLLDRVTVTYQRDSAGKMLRLPVSSAENEADRLGAPVNERLDLGSFSNRDTALGIALDYMARWSVEQPRVSWRQDIRVWPRPGSSVDLTCGGLLGVDSSTEEPTEGTTASRVLIESVTPDAERFTLEVEGRHTGIHSGTVRRIGPALLITGARTGNTIPVTQNEFVASGANNVGLAEDTDAVSVAQLYDILDGDDCTVLQAAVELASVTSTSATFSTTITATVASGDLIVPTLLVTAGGTGDDGYTAYISDSLETLGSGAGDGHRYEG